VAVHIRNGPQIPAILELIQPELKYGIFDLNGHKCIGPNFGVSGGPIHELAPILNEISIDYMMEIYRPLAEMEYVDILRQHNGCQLFRGNLVLFGFWYQVNPVFKPMSTVTWDISTPNRENSEICNEYGGQIFARSRHKEQEYYILELESHQIIGVDRFTRKQLMTWDCITDFLKHEIKKQRSLFEENAT
jgi:hypothetical protein